MQKIDENFLCLAVLGACLSAPYFANATDANKSSTHIILPSTSKEAPTDTVNVARKRIFDQLAKYESELRQTNEKNKLNNSDDPSDFTNKMNALQRSRDYVITNTNLDYLNQLAKADSYIKEMVKNTDSPIAVSSNQESASTVFIPTKTTTVPQPNQANTGDGDLAVSTALVGTKLTGIAIENKAVVKSGLDEVAYNQNALTGQILTAYINTKLSDQQKVEAAAEKTPSANSYASQRATLSERMSETSSNEREKMSAQDRTQAVDTYVAAARDSLGLGSNKISLEKSAIYTQAPNDIKDFVQNNLKSIAKNDLLGATPQYDLNALTTLAENAKFQDFAETTLGSEKTKQLNLAVAGANILNDENISLQDAQSLAASISQSAALPFPKLVGETFSAAPELTKELSSLIGSSGIEIPPLAEEWIEIARLISSDAEIKKLPTSRETAKILKEGNQQLTDLINDLRAYKGLNFLALVNIPPKVSAPRLIEQARKTAMKALNSTSRLKISELEDPETRREIKLLVDFSSSKIRKLNSNISNEDTLAQLKECFELDDRRMAWRAHSKNDYLAIRLATATYIFSLKLSEIGSGTPFDSLLQATFEHLRQKNFRARQKELAERYQEAIAKKRLPKVPTDQTPQVKSKKSTLVEEEID